MIVAISLALATSLVVFYRGQLLKESFRDLAFFYEVIKGTSELSDLARDYASSQSERSRTQWHKRYASLEKLLLTTELSDADSKAASAKMVQDIGVSKGLFEQVASNYASARNQTGVMREMKLASNARAIARLLAKAQVMSNDAALMAEIGTQKALVAQRRVFLTILMLSLSMLLVIAFIAFILGRSVVRGLKELEAGTRAISRGDLDHRISIRTDDEIGNVSRTFNDMAAKLKGNYLELQKSRDELGILVEERTAELQEGMKQLKAANKELEAFIYSVSHDLRQPLRAIASFAQIVWKGLREGLADREKGYLNRIVDNAEKMSHLIESMLKLSRVSRQEIKRERIDLTRMAEALVSGIREAHPEGCTEIAIGDGLFAVADEGLMTAVLENLIGNACKFTAGKEKARVEFGAMQQDGERVFFVRDNGAGFDTAYVESLFKPFHRLHS
ncbi:MAG: HAMP domain-containing protein, partial [Syntrophales bacterium]|nr:HAMP domain-containing protein [Syntrophales bacterium]